MASYYDRRNPRQGGEDHPRCTSCGAAVYLGQECLVEFHGLLCYPCGLAREMAQEQAAASEGASRDHSDPQADLTP